MTDQAPELLPCRAKRDDLGYRCGECGASWIGRQNPPDCLRNQIARTVLKKFLGVDDFKKTTEGWDAGCIELAGEILALTRPPSERPVAQELLNRALAILHRFGTENTGWRSFFRRWYYSDEPLRNDAANLVREAGFNMAMPYDTQLVDRDRH